MKRITVLLVLFVLASGHVLGQAGFSNSNLSGTYPFSLSGVSSSILTFQPQVPLQTLVNGQPTELLLPMDTQPLQVLTVDPSGAVVVQTVQIPLDVRFPPAQYTVGFPVLQPLSITGTFTADGAGNITGGGGFFFSQKYVPQGAIDPSTGFRFGGTYQVEDASCSFTLTGTYSINPDGSGTITLQPVGPCVAAQVSAGATFNILLGRKGNAGIMNMVFSIPPAAPPTTFSTFMSGSFIKQ